MALTDRMEEVLEALWGELVEKGKQGCDAAILKDDQAVKDLNRAGYIKIKGSIVSLTGPGEEEAKSCARRHRLAERLMVDLLDIKKRLAHEPSCKFEHLLHKGLDESVCTLLGHPKTCPHGRSIPEGNCCKQARRTPGRLIVSLPELEKNKKAKISYIQTQDKAALQKLIAIGALPATEITLIQKFPSYVFQIGKSRFAVDKELASHIYVRMI